MIHETHSKLLDLYFNQEKEELLLMMKDIIEDLYPIAIYAIFEILEDTEDVDIIGLSLELLYLKRDMVSSDIQAKIENTTSDELKRALLGVLCITPSLASMIFILKQYFHFIDLRPMIRDMVFKHKKLLLAGLAEYVESNALSDEEEEAATEILKLIPREVFLDMKGTLTSFKIYDLYYAIPPKDRHSAKPPE